MNRGYAVPLGWLRSLWRRKLVLVLSAAVGGALGVAVANVLPVRFTSEGLILVDDRTPSTIPEPNATAAGAPGSNRTRTEADIIRSRKIAESVVTRLRLADGAELRSAPRWPAWLLPWATGAEAAIDRVLGNDPDAIATMSREEKEAAAVEAVQRRLHVVIDPKSTVISVRFSAPSGALAATVVNAVMDAYVAEELVVREQTTSQANRRLNEYLAALQAAFDDAERKVQVFSAENAGRDGPANAMLDQLKRERDSRAQAYYAFLARIEQIRMSSGEVTTARIISPAKPTFRPDGPTLPMAALLGAVIALLAMAAVIIGRHVLRARIGSPRELAIASGVTNVGTLPFSRPWARPGRALAILEERDSGIVQTLRGMRIALRGLSPSPAGGTAVLVTSAERGDGKSTIAASLAGVCAADGLRVLLVEGDLYRPRLASILGCQPGGSLESVLAGEDDFEDAVHVDPRTGLHGLFAAGNAESPQAMLESQAFRDLMARARRDYELVIVDSPPVLSVADPIVLAAHSDAMLFAVGWERISRAQLLEALERLPRGMPGEVMTVLTGVPRRHLDRQGYFRGYGRTVTGAGPLLRPAARPQTAAAVRRVLADSARPAEPISTGPATPQPNEPAAPGDAATARRRWAPSGVAVTGAIVAVFVGALMLIYPPVESADEAQRRTQRQSDRTSPGPQEPPPARTAAEATRKAEQEAAQKAAAEKQAAESAARRRSEEIERQRAAAAEAERRAQEEAASRAAAEKAAAEAEARRVAEERALAEAAARIAAEEKAAADAATRRKEEEAAREAAETARREAERQARLEAEARAAAEAEAAARARGLEEEARRAAAERAAAEAAARWREDEARWAAEQKARAEAAARQEAEAEARAKAEAEARETAEAAVREKAEAEAREKAEAAARETAQAEAREKAEAAARQKAEVEAREKAAIAAREKAEAEARAAAEENARRQATEEARRKAEEEARRVADARPPKSDAESRQQAEAVEAALRLSEPDRKRVQVALTSLGQDVRSTSGTFGPRTRAMIAAWQKKQGLPETGYLTAAQLATLQQQAAPALARYDDAQRKPDATPRGNEDEGQPPEAAEGALRLSEQDRRRVQVALNALGHDIGGVTGFFGPRTRAMITAWQKKQGLPETGYLTATQLTTLRQQAATALSRYDQAQRAASDAQQRTEQ